MANAVDAVMGKIEPDLRKNGGSFRPPKGSRSFAILRVGKISGMGKVAAAAQHNLRERDTANARHEDRDRNIHLAGAKTTDELMKLWEERAPEKIRKNAVHALEYVITASPEKMAAMGQTESEDYLRDAFAWIEEKHGAENVLSAVIHNDETTPHLQVMLIPLDERGKLNARALVGGKAQLSAMQTDFAERVGRKHGLERGIERSGASHETIRSFYGRANAVESLSFDVPERATGGFLGRGVETDAEYQERLSEAFSERFRDIAGGYAASLRAVTSERDTYKLKLADTEYKLEREALMVKAMAVAHNITFYEGDDRPEHIAKFERNYLDRGEGFTDEVKDIIDNLLEDMGARGFRHIEQEREAADRLARERNEIATREREERERQDDRHDRDDVRER